MEKVIAAFLHNSLGKCQLNCITRFLVEGQKLSQEEVEVRHQKLLVTVGEL